jgi:leader peptidase (prepilin peptidase)/N-methyltransferase
MVTAVISGLYGLLFGSFANVVIHRIPRGESIVLPRSACPSCGQCIAARDNIPVISWLLLGGRCRGCGDRIGPRYPVVELTAAALFVIVGAAEGLSWVLPAQLFFVWALLALSVIDIDTHRLPNALLYPCMGVSAVLLVAAGAIEGDVRSLVESLVGGVLAFLVMFVVWFVARGGLGYGDVRLSGYIGLNLGFLTLGHVPVALFVGFLAGAIAGIVLMVVAGRGRKHKVAFGPSLAVGGFVALIWGQSLIDLYLGR